MTGGLSRSQVVQARLAAALIVGLIVLGAVWYGISFVSLDRLWSDSFARRGGPMTFPLHSATGNGRYCGVARRHGGGRFGRTPYLTPYLMSILRGVQPRGGRLSEGIVSTARILILGIVMDTVYQWLVLKTFYPATAAVIAVLLAFVPYLLLRGPIERVARHLVTRPASK